MIPSPDDYRREADQAEAERTKRERYAALRLDHRVAELRAAGTSEPEAVFAVVSESTAPVPLGWRITRAFLVNVRRGMTEREALVSVFSTLSDAERAEWLLEASSGWLREYHGFAAPQDREGWPGFLAAVRAGIDADDPEFMARLEAQLAEDATSE